MYDTSNEKHVHAAVDASVLDTLGNGVMGPGPSTLGRC